MSDRRHVSDESCVSNIFQGYMYFKLALNRRIYELVMGYLFFLLVGQIEFSGMFVFEVKSFQNLHIFHCYELLLFESRFIGSSDILHGRNYPSKVEFTLNNRERPVPNPEYTKNLRFIHPFHPNNWCKIPSRTSSSFFNRNLHPRKSHNYEE